MKAQPAIGRLAHAGRAAGVVLGRASITRARPACKAATSPALAAGHRLQILIVDLATLADPRNTGKHQVDGVGGLLHRHHPYPSGMRVPSSSRVALGSASSLWRKASSRRLFSTTLRSISARPDASLMRSVPLSFSAEPARGLSAVVRCEEPVSHAARRRAKGGPARIELPRTPSTRSSQKEDSTSFGAWPSP
jgi:hypothetical protein